MKTADTVKPVRLSGSTIPARTVELMTIGIAGISILNYSAGLIIVSVHLQRYGLRVFDLIRTEYILVGGMWLFLTCVTIALLAALERAIPSIWKEPNALACRVSLVAAALTGGTFFIFMMLKLFTGDEPFLSIGGSFAAAFISMLLSGFFIWSVGEKAYNRFRQSRERENWSAVDVVDPGRVLVAVACFMAIYSTGVYPTLLPSFGGGKPQKLSIVLTPALVEPIRALGLCRDTSGSTCGPLQLILETQQAYFVIVPESRTSAGAKSSVKTARLPKSDMLVRYE
jgi:hypothetical protein